jgi:hypothetical protein
MTTHETDDLSATTNDVAREMMRTILCLAQSCIQALARPLERCVAELACLPLDKPWRKHFPLHATKRTMRQQQKKNTLPRSPGKTALCAPALHSVWLGDIPVYHGPPRLTWPVQDTTSRFVCCSFTKQYTKTMDSKGDSKSLS